MKYGETVRTALSGVLNEITQPALVPVIDRYSGVLAAADGSSPDLGHGFQARP